MDPSHIRTIPNPFVFNGRELVVQTRISSGRSSDVYRVKDGQNVRALKIEKTKSPRVNMVKKEVNNLFAANAVNVGPRFFEADAVQKAILMEFVDGEPFGTWAIRAEPKKLLLVLKKILGQARRLDAAGIDHGQLAGKMHNILVGKKNRVTIIDFEKASQNRKTHNERQLQGFLLRNPGGKLAGLIRARLNPKQIKAITN